MSQFTIITADGKAEQLVIKRVDETNADIPAAGSVKLSLADCAGEALTVKPCLAVVGGVLKTIYIVTSDAPDLIGGGGSVWL
jgi:hypothetical protein